jgi:alpha-ribazole phosphatase
MIMTIVRHGLTQGNAEQRWVGSTDMPLSEEGLRQAQSASRDDSIRRVYVSPLRRTQQTAAILYPNAEQVIVPGIREMGFGVFEGKGHDELRDDPVFIQWNVNGGMDPMPDGEGRRDFGLRVIKALDELIKAAISTGEKSLHILAHGGTIMALMAAFGIPKKPYHEWWVENLSGYRMRIDEETWAEEPRFCDVERISFVPVEALTEQ